MFLRGIELVNDVIFLKWSLRNPNKIRSLRYSCTIVAFILEISNKNYFEKQHMCTCMMIQALSAQNVKNETYNCLSETQTGA